MAFCCGLLYLQVSFSGICAFSGVLVYLGILVFCDSLGILCYLVFFLGFEVYNRFSGWFLGSICGKLGFSGDFGYLWGNCGILVIFTCF